MNPIKIATEADRKAAISVLRHMKIDAEQPLELRFAVWKKNRSAGQHRLYFKWVTIIAEHLGYSVDELHERFKLNYAVNILIRDDQKYAEGIIALKAALAKASDDEAKPLRQFIIRQTSTKVFKVKQMSEFMFNIQGFASDMGIVLPS